jgi:N,N'-diacetyllegionaminate synthase
MKSIKIGNKDVGDGFATFVIAEAGCNHNGDIGLAKKLIDSAVKSSADIVKFQSYHAELMYSKKTPIMQHFRERMGFGEGATMFDLIKATELPYEHHEPINAYCHDNNIPFASTPFDEETVDFLEQFDPPMYKVASFELVHYPLLRKVAQTGKPLVLSTGMATLGDIENALMVIQREADSQVALLHCVSNYPALPEDYNLRVIETLKRSFDVPVGISDHTPGIETALIAVAAGANLVEKHITVDQTLPGPDHHFSLDVRELCELVSGVRRVEKMLGSSIKHCVPAEEDMKHIGRRSLVAAVDIEAGQTITETAVCIKRPGFGLHPIHFETIIGARAKNSIEADTPLEWDDLLTKD